MPVVNKLTPSTRAVLNEHIAQIEAEKGYKICGARRRTADHKPCSMKAGAGTDHPGIGRCEDHGGKNQSPASAKYTNGSTAKIKYPDIIEKVKHLREDRDVFDLRDHIFLMEAIAETILENAEEVEDLYPLVKVIDSVTKAVQRLHEIEVGRRYVISIENLGSIINRITDVIVRHVPDPYQRSLIAEDIQKVQHMPIPALDPSRVDA